MLGGISSKMNVPRIASVELILQLECQKTYIARRKQMFREMINHILCLVKEWPVSYLVN